MWRHLLWLTTVAVAFALNQREPVTLDDARQAGQLSNLFVEQGTEAEVPARSELRLNSDYSEIPGLSFTEDSQHVDAQSLPRCRKACNDRGSSCTSFSFHTGTGECMLSASDMLFDPDSSLSIRKETGGYYNVPGLSYFHDKHGEWLRTTVADRVKCEGLCNQAKECKGFKWTRTIQRCSLTGKKIEFGSQWSYYTKSHLAPPVATHHVETLESAQQRVQDLHQKIKSEQATLQAEKDHLQAVKQAAKDHLEKQAEDSHAIALMRKELEQAKVAAKKQVREALEEQKLSKRTSDMQHETQDTLNVASIQAKNQAKIKKAQAAAEAEAAKQVQRVKAKVVAVEEKSEKNSEHRELHSKVKAAQTAAIHEQDQAKQASDRLASAKASLSAAIENDVGMLEARKKEDEMSIQEDKKAAEHAVKQAGQAATNGAQREARMTNLAVTGSTKGQLAKMAAEQKNAAARHNSEWRQIRQRSSWLKNEEEQWKAKQKETSDRVLQLAKRRTVERKRALEAQEIVQSTTNSTTNVTEVDDAVDEKLLQSLMKAKEEAAAAEAKAKLEAEEEIKRAEAQAAKLKKAAAEKNAKASEQASAEKAQAAKAEAERVENLKKTYSKLMGKAHEIARTGIDKVKAVAEEAENLEDHDKAVKMLESAKANWRSNVRHAMDKADKVKEEIPDEPVSVIVEPEQVISLGQNTTSDS